MIQTTIQMQKEEEIEIDTIDKLTQKWNNAADAYQYFDSCMQTFYYTLINMMDISKGKNILEVACGTGGLIPLALQIKDKEACYLATDLCQNMVESAKERVKMLLGKIGVEESAQKWMQKQKLEFRVANGEQHIESQHKFDRIIANLVLMATEDPHKMMKNFHSLSTQDSILGVTIWGNQQHSNLLTIMSQAMSQNNIPIPKERPHSHLYNNIEELAGETGWRVIVQWQQNAPFHFMYLSEELKKVIGYWCRGKDVLMEFYFRRVEEIFAEKKILNFPVQMAILMKK